MDRDNRISDATVDRLQIAQGILQRRSFAHGDPIVHYQLSGQAMDVPGALAQGGNWVNTSRYDDEVSVSAGAHPVDFGIASAEQVSINIRLVEIDVSAVD